MQIHCLNCGSVVGITEVCLLKDNTRSGYEVTVFTAVDEDFVTVPLCIYCKEAIREALRERKYWEKEKKDANEMRQLWGG